MPMISYAGHAEDVVLARLFADTAKGRYVDVGAARPVEGSVTKHFYDKGWCGVNIEPDPSLARLLRQIRPRDVNLAVAVGASPGSATLRVMPDFWGWATLDDQLAQGYRRAEPELRIETVDVEVVTLEHVLDEYPGDVDFLKIDVELAEHDVIAGADFSRHRPRVIVVEATLPGSRTPSHETWEPMLVAADYRCALFDGLNRFYAQSDDAEALACLAAPANVFDDFESHQLHAMREAAARVDAVRVGEVGYIRSLQETIKREREARVAAERHAETLRGAAEDHVRQKLAAQRYAAALEQRIAELESARP